jgi:hypothetical protein
MGQNTGSLASSEKIRRQVSQKLATGEGLK